MKRRRLKDIISIKKGKKHLLIDEPDKSSKRVIQIDDLRNDTLIKYTNDNKGVYANKKDILIVWDGANAGTVGYSKEGYIGSTIALLRVNNSDEYNTVFLGKFLQSKFNYLRSKTTGATIPHIKRTSLEQLKVPEIDIYDQHRIATILSMVETLITQRKESLLLLDELLKNTFGEMFGDPVINEKGWDVRPLGSIFKVKHGFAFKSEFFRDVGSFVLWSYPRKVDTVNL